MTDPWTPADEQIRSSDRPAKRMKVTTDPEEPPSPSSSSSSSPATPISPISSAPPSPSLSSSSEIPQASETDESVSTTSLAESTSTEATSPTPSDSEFERLEKEFKTTQEYMDRTLTRLRHDVVSFKSLLAVKEKQNMERLKLLKTKINTFPDNEIEMLQVVMIEMLGRNSRRNKLAEALQGLVEIQDSCEFEGANNGNKFSITYITS